MLTYNPFGSYSTNRTRNFRLTKNQLSESYSWEGQPPYNPDTYDCVAYEILSDFENGGKNYFWKSTNCKTTRP